MVFSGDLVEYKSRLLLRRRALHRLAGDADASRDLQAEALVPGRGAALAGAGHGDEGIALTARFPARHSTAGAAQRRGRAHSLKECFDAATRGHGPEVRQLADLRALPALQRRRAPTTKRSGIDMPVIWTAERDRAMWAALQG